MIKTRADAERFLLNNYPKYEILDFGESWSSPAKIIDKERLIDFDVFSFSQFKTYLKKYPNRIFGATEEEFSNIVKNNWEMKTKEDKDFFNQKREKTNLKKYGCSTPLKNEEVKNKIKKTNLKKYGVENVSQNKNIKEQKKKTTLFNYGVTNPSQSKEIQKRKEETVFKNYGVINPSFSKEIQLKRENTFIERYGFSSPLKNEEVLKKGIETKKRLGIIEQFDGKTLVDICQEKDIPYSTGAAIRQKHGIEFLSHLYKKNKTIIENTVFNLLTQQKLEFQHNKSFDGVNYRPDFLVLSNNLIIECDGLYWHSEVRQKDKNYHKNKQQIYKSFGYDSLFFREDEILNKFDIVRSIILNKFNKSSDKAYARKCDIRNVDKDETQNFLNKNHLMGRGTGRGYGLYLKGELVCLIQVRWKNKKDKFLEISRFCSKLNCSVAGGWSKLIAHVIKIEQPNKIMTFIDRRYGSGDYLKKMGWTKVSEGLSFRWTDFKETIHRMKYPGNSGRENGLYKIWDCGQAKWEKKINVFS